VCFQRPLAVEKDKERKKISLLFFWKKESKIKKTNWENFFPIEGAFSTSIIRKSFKTKKTNCWVERSESQQIEVNLSQAALRAAWHQFSLPGFLF